MLRWLLISVALALPTVAQAHHEAIFGPQSSLVLSAPGFVSAQVFSRQLGPATDRTQETTFLVSGGVSPFSFPLSLTLIVPFSYISQLDQNQSRGGPEDLIAGTRYRFDIQSLNQRRGHDGNFLMGMVALDLPTGTIDHPAFDGPLDEMLAGLGSLEWSTLSAIGYVFFRHNGARSDSSHAGDSLIVGGGLAYTPWEERTTGRLISLQLGWSIEDTFTSNPTFAPSGLPSGGTELLLHPTIVWGPGAHLLVFVVGSVPVADSFSDPYERDRFRVGAGLTYLFASD